MVRQSAGGDPAEDPGLSLRVVFLGSQEIGARCLEVILAAGHEVVGVGTFDPDPHESWADEVVRLVERHGLRRARHEQR